LPDPIWIKTILKALLLPPAGPLLVALAGIVLWGRLPRVGRGLAAFGVASLLLLSTPAIAWLLLRAVEAAPPLDLEKAKAAEAIVILGGGTRRNAPEYGGDTLARLTLERVRYGARVARITALPVLVTGGAFDGGVPEGLLMRDALQAEFGIDVRWTETASRNTRENAMASAKILTASGVKRIVLVAHSFDMRRAVAEFVRAGIEVVPAPTVIPPERLDRATDFLPSMGALQASYYALYEILANTVAIADP
jgi:uncharacterized SAM-binding protein YcdF (DUF218 family)